MAKANSVSGELLAGLTGGAVFIFMFVVAGLGFFFSMAGAVAGFIAGSMIFRSKKTGTDFLFNGISAETLRTVVSDGETKLKELQGYARKVTDRRVREEVEEIAELVVKILKDIEDDPADIPKARKALGYYLDATNKILARYTDLTSRGISDASLRNSLRKVEEGLKSIRKAFEKLLVQLLENDVMDLDTELQLLERTIKMEGLADNE